MAGYKGASHDKVPDEWCRPATWPARHRTSSFLRSFQEPWFTISIGIRISLKNWAVRCTTRISVGVVHYPSSSRIFRQQPLCKEKADERWLQTFTENRTISRRARAASSFRSSRALCARSRTCRSQRTAWANGGPFRASASPTFEDSRQHLSRGERGRRSEERPHAVGAAQDQGRGRDGVGVVRAHRRARELRQHSLRVKVPERRGLPWEVPEWRKTREGNFQVAERRRLHRGVSERQEARQGHAGIRGRHG